MLVLRPSPCPTCQPAWGAWCEWHTPRESVSLAPEQATSVADPYAEARQRLRLRDSVVSAWEHNHGRGYVPSGDPLEGPLSYQALRMRRTLDQPLLGAHTR